MSFEKGFKIKKFYIAAVTILIPLIVLFTFPGAIFSDIQGTIAGYAGSTAAPATAHPAEITAPTIIVDTVLPQDTSTTETPDSSITMETQSEGMPTATETVELPAESTTSIETAPSVDIEPPVIILNGDAVVNLEPGDVFVDPGATAFDDAEGDMTGLIVVLNKVDATVPGSYMVTYNVSDKAGNAAVEAVRVVNIPDVTPPLINLNGGNTVIIVVGSIYTDPGATAFDDAEGDMTGLIVVLNKVDATVPGSYMVTYNVSDKAGNAAVEAVRVVNVFPQPTIFTDKPDYLPNDYVLVTGSGWLPGETVKLDFHETLFDLLSQQTITYYAIADIEGKITNIEYLIELRHLGASFILEATGLSSGLSAQAAFTDATQATPTFSPVAGAVAYDTLVTITSAGATTIYFTLDGSTPTVSSDIYSSPVAINGAMTVKALAVRTGYTNSAIGSASYTITTAQATPAFSPVAGAVAFGTAVTITSSGATAIYYTTNGTTPTTSSALYTGPVVINSAMTLKALAVRTGWTNSAIGSAAYTITNVQPTPAFSPSTGSVALGTAVTITSSGATAIYYTTNGTTPTTSSALYTGPVTINDAMTLKALAVRTGWTNSTIGSASYTITTAQATPAFSPVAGAVSFGTAVTITSSGATAIYYTTNGTTPTTSSALYTGPVTINDAMTLKALAVRTGWTNSTIGSASYTITTAQATPAFSPVAGAVSFGTAVTITSSGATAIYYTTNGTTPTTSSALYTGPVTINDAMTLKALAVRTGWTNSTIGSASYTITTAQATPVFSLPTGEVDYGASVTITSAGATAIYYTINGDTPTTSSTLYAGPVIINSAMTVKALAVRTGWADSAVESASYLPENTSDLTNILLSGTPGGFTFTEDTLTYNGVTVSNSVTNITVTPTDDGDGTITVESETVVSGTASSPIALTAGIEKTITVTVTEIGKLQQTYIINITRLGNQATPVFSPSAGAIALGTAVTITSSGATNIYYTTNGDTPTTSSTLYAGPVTIDAAKTLKALAVKTGWADSAVGSAVYTQAASEDLANIFLSGTPLGFTFSSGTYTYNGVTVYNSISSITVTPTGAGTITVDGTTVASGTPSGLIALTAGVEKTITVIATETGDTPKTYTIKVTRLGTQATPTFSPVAGAVAFGATVTITSASADHIYYTTNGDTPTTSSTLYSSAVTIDDALTLRALAVKTGWADSAVGSAAYTITDLQATPVFSPSAGAIALGTAVTITSSGATNIYYTTNGDTPTTSSTLYAGPVTIDAAKTLKALAVKTGWADSAVGSAVYTQAASEDLANIFLSGTPLGFTFSSGTYTYNGVTVYNSISSITVTPTGAGTITVDGTTVASGTPSGLIALTAGVEKTITVIATETGDTPKTYTIKVTRLGTQATPTFSPVAGAVAFGATVTITSASADHIYYTTNGDTPTTSSTLYSSAVTIDDALTLRALAVKTGWADSAVGSAAYTITNAQATPTFNPSAGGVSFETEVTIISVNADHIYYTTNGDSPTISSTLYTGPVTINDALTLKALAVRTGWADSEIGSAAYTMTTPQITPTFSPVAGGVSSGTFVTITSANADHIYYTTDGTDPTSSNTLYTGPVNINDAKILRALAVRTGWPDSAVGSASYTITTPQATPTFSPVAGAVAFGATVTITSASADHIYYTTNGDTPTTSSTLYSSAVTIDDALTLRALAVKTGWADSAVGSAAYTITDLQATPVFSPSAGAIALGTAVTITSSGATNIYYTTNGDTPTTSSTLYAGPVTIDAAKTLKALAVKTGWADSAVGSAVYTQAASEDLANIFLSGTPLGFTFSSGTYTYNGVTVYNSISSITVTPTGAGTITVDGTTVASGTPSGLIALTAGVEKTITVIATETGDTPKTYTIKVTRLGTQATPTFSPVAGAVAFGATVTITSASADHIYYTTNGDTPTTSSTLYSSAVTIDDALTLRALAVKTGWADSAVGSAAYTITDLQATPVFSPSAGAIALGTAVTITSSGATNIYYTTNGDTPTTSSTLYAGPVTIDAAKTLKALAVKTGWADSAVGSAVYTQAASEDLANIFLSGTPLGFTFSSGTYTYNGVTVYNSISSITVTPTGAGTITVDGTTVASGTPSGLIALTAGVEKTITVIATETGDTPKTYTIKVTRLGTQATPTFSPVAGAVAFGATVTITSASADHIYYTTNGDTPTTSSTLYSSAVTIDDALTLRALAVKTGWADSAVGSAAYTITNAQAAPAFNPATGAVALGASVTITSSGATAIYYTTNGDTPTISSTLYTGPVTINDALTLKALAVRTGWSNSAIVSSSYTITTAQATPTFSPVAGAVDFGTTVAITSSGATAIYYTTNGSNPTTSSTLYTGSVTINDAMTVRAMAIRTGWVKSAIGSAAYTITNAQATPTFSISAGAVAFGTETAIISSGATSIYYTTNGSTPTTSSTLYTGPVTIDDALTLKALALRTGWTDSSVGSAAYTITNAQAAPEFNPATGEVAFGSEVAITSAGATNIYYTANGDTPTTSSTLYTGPVAINSSVVLKALAVKTGWDNSAIESAAYIPEDIADLASIVLSGSPSGFTFLSATHLYSGVTVANSIESITVTPTDDGDETITVDGVVVPSGETSDPIALTAGVEKTINIITVENAKLPETYTIRITRLAIPAAPAPGPAAATDMEDQIINFEAPGNKTYGDADFSLNATASSGLTVTFTATGNCTVSGATVHITGAGNCKITAHQAGNDSYSAALDVERDLYIAKKTITVAADSGQSKIYGSVDPIQFTYSITNGGKLIGSDSFTGSPDRVAGNNVGAYAIKQGTLTAGANYTIIFVESSMSITRAPLIVTVEDVFCLKGQADLAFTGRITGIQYLDNLTAIYDCTAGTDSMPGTYPIVATLVDPDNKSGNYDVTINNGTLKIASDVVTDKEEVSGYETDTITTSAATVEDAASETGRVGVFSTKTLIIAGIILSAAALSLILVFALRKKRAK